MTPSLLTLLICCEGLSWRLLTNEIPLLVTPPSKDPPTGSHWKTLELIMARYSVHPSTPAHTYVHGLG